MKKTALYEKHKSLGAKIVEFAGYLMPIQYTSVIEEHQNVRKNAGLFDVSHMGQIEFVGDNAIPAANYFITNDLNLVPVGSAIYSPMCNHRGGIVDDVIAYKISESRVLFCVNAANVEKDYRWIVDNNRFDVSIENRSNEYSQLALQGPKAPAILDEIFPGYGNMAPFKLEFVEFEGVKLLLSTTGYTGEAGFELYIPDDNAARKLWDVILEKEKPYEVKPAGLGARDTLRLEMKYCLYGNDITEDTNPIEAGLKWTVKLDNHDFIGKDAILKVLESGIKRKLVGFKLTERGVPRHGNKVLKNGKVVGFVTSGNMSPTLKEPIGLAYIDKPFYKRGTEIEVEIRGKAKKGIVVKTPFVKTKKG